MPKLPEVEPSMRNGSEFTSKEHAEAVARVLAGKMGPNDRDRWATVTRVYFQKNSKARARLISWYEKQ